MVQPSMINTTSEIDLIILAIRAILPAGRIRKKNNMPSLLKLPSFLALFLVVASCSNKNVNFMGPNLDTPAYDGTLARVSIYGISDGYDQTDAKVVSELQTTAKQKFQNNPSLFSGSSNNLYTLTIDTFSDEDDIACEATKLSQISRGTLTTQYTLATLERTPQTLFDVEIRTQGHHESSRMSDVVNAINCGTKTAIAKDAISRSMRIFDLLVKEANGLDVSREIAAVEQDKDLQGTAIVMRMISGTLYTVAVPIGVTIQAAADTDWSNTISAAAKAADGMSSTHADPLKNLDRPPAYIQPSPQPLQTDQISPSLPQRSLQQRAPESQGSPAAASTVRKPPSRTRSTVEIQSRGSTDMHFPYEQALDLATTNADTEARRQCRENYRGKITTLSDPNMVRKECSQNHNNEYRCVVQLTHSCEYSQ